LLPASNFRRAFPSATDTQILTCIGTPEQFRVGIAKVTYNQFSSAIQRWAVQNEAPIVHLTRRNVVRTAASQLITGMAVNNRIDHAAHSYHRMPPVRVSVDYRRLLYLCMRLVERKTAMQSRLLGMGVPVLDVFYADLVGGEGNQANAMDPVEAAKICDFLGIQRARLTAQLKRVNAYPLSKLLVNWAEVEYAIKHSPFKWCLDDEENFE
jgi:hypothetical protein